jgi:predicted DsbA family dithiol-disulfide isomerase
VCPQYTDLLVGRPDTVEAPPHTEETDPMAPTKTIEVFAEIGCPFAHVGLRRFVERRHELGRDDVVMWVRAWPLELVNQRPLDPAFIAEEIDEIRTQATPDLFTGFDVATFPASSLPAFALAAAAHRKDPHTGEAVSLALRQLLFEDGADVGSLDALAPLANQHGLTVEDIDHETVRADHADGVRRGVVGSPHFFTAGGGFFCPALDVSRDSHGHLRILANPDEFDRFVDACLT